MSLELVEIESKLNDFINKSHLSNDDADRLLLSFILTEYFSSLSRDTSMKYWAIDDMCPSEVRRTENKLTLLGDIHWLEGGGLAKCYQADIATDTIPLLYSIKLNNNYGKQLFYMGKTFNGWVLNVA